MEKSNLILQKGRITHWCLKMECWRKSDNKKNLLRVSTFVSLPDGKLNVFSLLDGYFSLKKSLGSFSNRSFLQFNSRARSVEKFFEGQFLGKKKAFGSVENQICKGAEIRCFGIQEYITAHGFRATITSLLSEAVHGNARVIYRTGRSQ